MVLKKSGYDINRYGKISFKKMIGRGLWKISKYGLAKINNLLVLKGKLKWEGLEKKTDKDSGTNI